MATIKLLPGVKQSFQQDESLNSSNRRTLPSSCSLSSRQQERIAEQKNRIMRVCHDGVDGSHFGRDKTLSKVSNKKDSVHKDVINVINPTVIFIGVTVILLEVNGKGCSRVLQML